MATKRQEMRPNRATGNFERLLGWKEDIQTGTVRQHKFYLGRDQAAAMLANQRLERLWAIVESEAGDMDARWDWLTIEMGKAIAKGETEFKVPRPPHMPPHNYVAYVNDWGRRFPVIACVPEDLAVFGQGIQMHSAFATQQISEAQKTIKAQVEYLKSVDAPIPTCEASLHQAFDAYIEFIRRTVLTAAVEGETQVTSLYGNVQIRNVQRLKERHPDMPLGQVGLNAIQEMIDAWRARPPVKGKAKPIAVKTATEHIKQLKKFFKWLHRNEDFAWRKPEDFAELVVSVKPNQREKAAKISPLQVKTFTEEQLCLLYKYGTPFERLLFLLGLNCGFGAGEISTLLVREVHLLERHPHDRVLGFVSSDEDSFIKRLRPKTDVYGEWLLWPETVQAMQWVVQRRRNQKAITRGLDKGKVITATPDSVLILSGDGTPLIKQTENGNRSNRIANLWEAGLCSRIRKDHADFPTLSFGKLRKTAGELVKQQSDGEVAAVFLCHGQPVQSDELLDLYTNRPFARLFEAIKSVRKRLDGVFQFKADWPPEPKKGGPNITVRTSEEIERLLDEGLPVAEIAQRVGVSKMAVYRRRDRTSGHGDQLECDSDVPSGQPSS